MVRFATAAAASVIASVAITGVASAVDSRSCPPVTSVKVTHVSGTAYRMQITATNTCKCRLYFVACSTDATKPRCASPKRIGAGQTEKVDIRASKADGKANFRWWCP
ncbi:MAG TPA: hypothetical protein VG758_03940 [Hyphomicrobiaceae bacterium]|jgi:hypothetical protein|nr:hypothetical protein [Hyphomicrobiaceae bacterium]